MAASCRSPLQSIVTTLHELTKCFIVECIPSALVLCHTNMPSLVKAGGNDVVLSILSFLFLGERIRTRLMHCVQEKQTRNCILKKYWIISLLEPMSPMFRLFWSINGGELQRTDSLVDLVRYCCGVDFRCVENVKHFQYIKMYSAQVTRKIKRQARTWKLLLKYQIKCWCLCGKHAVQN